MRYPITTITALASSLVLLTAIELPAKAGPAFDLKSAAGATGNMVELVGHGGGGGGGHMGGGGGGHMSAFRGGGGNMGVNVYGRSFASRSGANFDHGHVGRSFTSRSGVNFDNGHMGRGRSFASNERINSFDHHHHNHFKRFYAYPFFYDGGYYAYNGYYSCNGLRRRAIATGSAYWWQRYQECEYY
jgi:hypothetical protein